ncbi:HPP family protein [Pseudoalteromonas lipolytica]|uniref:HPP family protein n=1 Tax=Pseudoalteromonas lipolytica TaxID=570156 RepID=A0AAD0S026_9GAMM|nr:HPP family protein [Pseudoalteromonas donghaensis]AXV65615.1 HPP family protein [Pseudoalteromonas donghaensis]
MMDKTINKAVIAGGFAALAIFVLAYLQQRGDFGIWLMAPFGATAVLVFGVPTSPLARARNVIGGHLITAFIGVLFVNFVGVSPFEIAIASGLAISLMMLTRTVNPAAGANPILIMQSLQSWDFLVMPVLTGTVFIVLCGFVSQYLINISITGHKKTAN